MKISAFLPVLAVLALLSAPLAAQTAGDVVAHVPFAFEAGKLSFEPGTYVVHKTGIQGVVKIYRLGEGGGAMLMNLPKQDKRKDGKNLLVFTRYGDSHFLKQIWTGGPIGMELRPSPRERELASNGAAPTLAMIPGRSRRSGE